MSAHACSAKNFGGATYVIDNVTASDTVLRVKEIVFAANRKMHVRQQQLACRLGPHGLRYLANQETLGDAGMAQDGSAELVMRLEALPTAEAKKIGRKVYKRRTFRFPCVAF